MRPSSSRSPPHSEAERSSPEPCVVIADFPDVLGAVESAYQRHFAVAPARASITFLGVQPIEVLRFVELGQHNYLTLGMSSYPMSRSSATVRGGTSGSRAELLVSTIGRADGLRLQLAVLAAAPAVEGAVYEAGGSVDLGAPLILGSRCTGGLLVDGPLAPVAIAGAVYVRVLRLLPATEEELRWARVHGRAALLTRWSAQGTELADLGRHPADLD